MVCPARAIGPWTTPIEDKAVSCAIFVISVAFPACADEVSRIEHMRPDDLRVALRDDFEAFDALFSLLATEAKALKIRVNDDI